MNKQPDGAQRRTSRAGDLHVRVTAEAESLLHTEIAARLRRGERIKKGDLVDECIRRSLLDGMLDTGTE